MASYNTPETELQAKMLEAYQATQLRLSEIEESLRSFEVPVMKLRIERELLEDTTHDLREYLKSCGVISVEVKQAPTGDNELRENLEHVGTDP